VRSRQLVITYFIDADGNQTAIEETLGQSRVAWTQLGIPSSWRQQQS